MQKRTWIIFSVLLIPVLFLLGTNAYAYTSPGNPSGFVNDFAGMLSQEARAQIEQETRSFQEKKTHEISVVTVPSLGDDYIENYAEKLFKEWGIGKKGADNGVLLLISRDDKKMRIEVGYGLEGALTDAESSQIIRNTLRPAFQQGDFSGGIVQAVSEIERAIQEEVPIQTERSSFGLSEGVIEFLVWFGIVLLIWGVAIVERTKSWWLGGVIGGIVGLAIGLFVVGFILSIVWWVIGVALLGLGFDFLVSKNYQQSRLHGRRPSWWAGGGWGPGGGFGGGGGGFGGFGGGGSGGGGSSGGW